MAVTEALSHVDAENTEAPNLKAHCMANMQGEIVHACLSKR